MLITGLDSIQVVISINLFVIGWLLAGFFAPFIIFFAYGFLTKGSSLDPYAKLAVGWGSGCFFLTATIVAIGLFMAITGQKQPYDSVPPFIVGTVSGIMFLTLAVVFQVDKINEQEETRKKAYSFS